MCLHNWPAHTNRVKDLCLVPSFSGYLASISSDGFIKVWNVVKEPKLITEVETTARLTCLTATRFVDAPTRDSDDITQEKKKQKKSHKTQKEEENDDDDDEE